MLYCKLGNTGLTVSKVGFGAMRLPIRRSNPDFKRAVELIRYAVERGIDFFDVGTFYCHGHCEKAFGMATGDVPREKLLICGKNDSHQSRDRSWSAQLRNSLALFKRSFFDLYFIHYLTLEDWKHWFLEHGVIDEIKRAGAGGLFRRLGFSSHDSPENVRELIDTGMFEAVILSYNMLRREYEETLKYAHQKGLGVVVMNPLAGGALADGALCAGDAEAPDDPAKMAEISLNYVLSQPFVHVALSGMESKKIIDENVRTVHKRRFGREEIDSLDEEISKSRAAAMVPCTSCNYCAPCTQGIDIPEVIRLYNQYSVLKGGEMFVRDYAMLPVTAECCIQCNECVEKCTQHIDVPGIMENVSRLFLVGA